MAPVLFAPVAQAKVTCSEYDEDGLPDDCVGDGEAEVPAGMDVLSVTGCKRNTASKCSATVYGHVEEEAWGGDATPGAADENELIIHSGAYVGSGAVGGYSSSSASNNTVTIKGGTVGEWFPEGVYGGSGGSSASGNVVEILGGTVHGDVCGGRIYSGSATGNTVRISGTPNLARATLYGGSGAGDVITGNTLEMEVNKLQVAGVNNFQNITFTLPASTSAGDTVLTVTNPANLTGVNISVNSAIPTLAPGQKLTLISSVSGTLTPPSLPAGYEAEVDSSNALVLKPLITYPIIPVATPTAGGKVDCGATEVAQGGSITCTAKANAGYIYDEDSIKLKSGSATVSCDGATCTLSNITSPLTVSASFTEVAKTHNITATVSPAGSGSITCNPTTVEDGEDVRITCTAAPENGYKLDGLLLNGVPCSGSTCSASSVTSALTVSAAFSPITVPPVPRHSITVTSSGNGSITCTPTSVEDGKGVSITCRPSPASGYELGSLSLPGGLCSGTTCIAANVTGPLTVSATFKKKKTYAVAGATAIGGKVECSPASVGYGGSSTCTAKPDTGYALDGSPKLASGTASANCSGDTCALSNITSDVRVSATFKKKTAYVVIGSAGGKVECSPAGVDHGGGSTCTARPDAGYEVDEAPRLSSGTADADCSGDKCRLSSIASDVTVTATFKAATTPGTKPDLEVKIDTDEAGKFVFKTMRKNSSTVTVRNVGGVPATGAKWTATKAGVEAASGSFDLAANASTTLSIALDDAGLDGAEVCVEVALAGDTNTGNNRDCAPAKVVSSSGGGGAAAVPTVSEIGLLLSGIALVGAAAPALRRHEWRKRSRQD